MSRIVHKQFGEFTLVIFYSKWNEWDSAVLVMKEYSQRKCNQTVCMLNKGVSAMPVQALVSTPA